jgi:hypothetical protein
MIGIGGANNCICTGRQHQLFTVKC